MVYRLAEQDDWRSRYYESLREFEKEERQNRAQLQTLYKLVGRLCLAAEGQSPRLDEELDRLKRAIRKEVPREQLEPMSQAIADAVRDMDIAAGSSGLPPKSAAQHSPVTTASAAVTVAKASAPVSGAALAAVAPGGLAATATATATAAAVVAPATASGTVAPQNSPGATQAEARIRAVLSRLLGELGREPQLASGAQAIDAELAAASSVELLPQLIEKAGGLVVQRIASLEKARQEIESLLDQMMGQLDSLTNHMAGQADDESQRTRSTIALNEQISGEMRVIGEHMDNGSDLTLIRLQLRERLDSITRHLQSFRVREEERARQARERNETMRVRMDAMESEVRKLQERLTDKKRLLLLDPLTQIPNRLAWEQRIVEERERWKRFAEPTCLAAWDIDRFKHINDSYGHRAGDKVLTVVAEALAKSIRSTDFVARYGGEEFVMLLPGTTLDDGRRILEQMREAIARIGFHFRGTPVSVTISCGLTMLRDGDGEDDAFDRADKALYAAKNAGRNQVVSA